VSKALKEEVNDDERDERDAQNDNVVPGLVTKPPDDLAAQAEDVSARGPSRHLDSLHGGSRSLPDYGQTARENFEEAKESE
jgi:hypothetical protein